MISHRSIGRVALAEFLSGLISKSTHWYSIINPTKNGVVQSGLVNTFQPLCRLASLSEEMMQVLLLNCSLVQFQKNTGYSVLEQEWMNFKMEYQLMEMEVTHFTTMDIKKRYYVHLGSWNAISHKRVTPGEIWSLGDITIPSICTSSLSRTLAKVVGSLDVALLFEKAAAETSADNEDESSTSSDEEEIDDTSSSEDEVEPPLNLPDPN